MIPSLSDFATGDRALHGGLWSGCVFAHCPSLGNTGPKLYDFVNGQSAAISNYVASAWVYDNGLPVVENTESGTGTNRASYWTGLKLPSTSASYALWLYSAGQSSAAGNPITSGTAGVTFRMSVATSGILSATWANGSLGTTSPSAIASNTWTHVVCQRSRGGNRVEMFIDGMLVDSSSTGSGTAIGDAPVISILARNDSGTFSSRFAGRVDDCRVYNRMLSYEEVRLLASQRAVAYIPRRRLFSVIGSPVDDGATGTASTTLSSATSSAAGSVVVSGSSAATAGPATSTASGSQTVTGTASSQLGAATSTAAGGVGVTGTASSSLTGATSSAAGLLTLQGSAAVALSSAVSAAAGAVTNSGVCAATLGDATASASGQCLTGNSGPASSQLDDATSQCSGLVTVAGTGAGSASCQCASTGAVGYSGAAAGTLASATSASSGLVKIQGAVAATTGASAVVTGSVSVSGVVVATAGPATASALGFIPTTGQVVATLQGALVVASGTVTQTDLELTGVVQRAELDCVISVADCQSKVRRNALRGRKIWQ